MKMTKENILRLESYSPEELAGQLQKLSKDKAGMAGFMELSVYGPKILVRQFDLPCLKAAELKNALHLEAVELMHLKPEEIELDYQVLYRAEDKIQGLFAAAPKELLEEYIAGCKGAGFILTGISARVISEVNSFFQGHTIESNNFGILLFRPDNMVYLAGFDNHRCLLLREIRYETLSEAGQEITESLRYFFGKSVYKEGEVHICGEIADKESLIAKLESELNIKTLRDDAIEAAQGVGAPEGLFRINLIRRYAVSPRARNNIRRALNFALTACAALCIIAGIGAPNLHLQIKQITDSYKSSGHSYALSLQKKIDSFNNAQ